MPHTRHFFKGLSPRTIGWGSAIITVLVWTTFIVIARASADPARGGILTPFDLAFCRIVGASMVLLPWGWWLCKRDRARGEGQSSFFGLSPLPLRVTVTVGTFGGLLYAVLAYSGFVLAPAMHASVLMPGSLPFWTALLAAFLLKERITPMRSLGLGLIVLGDLLVGGASLLHAFSGGDVWKGDLLFMSAALCWAMYSVLARKNGLDAVRATMAITTLSFFCYVPIYIMVSFIQIGQSHLLAASWREVMFHMLFQGWGSVVISGIAFTKMIQFFGPVRATMITALVPGLSALGAIFWLDEPMQWSLLGGLTLVSAGILLGVRALVPVVRKPNPRSAYAVAPNC